MKSAYFNHNLIAAALIGLAAAGMASCSETDAPEAPAAPGKTYPMEWTGGIGEWNDDKNSRAGAAWTWQDGNTVILFESDQTTVLGRAIYSSATSSWTFEPSKSGVTSGACVGVFSPIDNEPATQILVTNTAPIFKGSGEYSIVEGLFRVSMVLNPACARMRFKSDSPVAFYANYANGTDRMNTNDFFTPATANNEFSSSQWTHGNDGLWYSPYVYIMDNIVPRIKIGQTVYRYKADAREPEAGMSILLTLPGTPGSEESWMSAPYVNYTTSMSRKNIFGTVTHTLMSQTLESAIGFHLFTELLWTPYSGTLTQTESNPYPFVLSMTLGGEQTTHPLCEIDGMSGTNWHITSLFNQTSIGNIKVISSGGNDVYVTLTDFTISNF